MHPFSHLQSHWFYLQILRQSIVQHTIFYSKSGILGAKVWKESERQKQKELKNDAQKNDFEKCKYWALNSYKQLSFSTNIAIRTA